MKANEIRIGNYIGVEEVDLNSGSEIISSYQCNLNDIAEIERGNVRNRYSPIPLTEEWLLKLGFSATSHLHNFYHEDNMYFQIMSTIRNTQTGERSGFYFDSDGFDLKLDHVHQLQNLYFALTGEELELKQFNPLK